MLLVYLFIFVGFVATVLLAYNRFIVLPERALLERLNPKPKKTKTAKAAPSQQIRKEQRPTTGIGAAVGRITPLMEPVQALLQQAGTKQHADEFLLMSAGLATLGALASSLVVGWKLGVPVGGVIGLIPMLVMSQKRSRRLGKFEELFPGALGLVSRALRAGHALPTGLKMVADEAQQPVGGEFRVIFEEQNFGLTLPEALRNFARRVPLLDARFFVVAVLIQRESGGNLSEVLANISDIMRERFAMQGEIDTLTAESRLSARILGVLPILVFIGISIVNPAFMRPMLQQPVGQVLLAVAAVSVLLGYLVMMSIADIDL